MGEVIFQLEQQLLSKQEKLTPQEVNVFLACKSKALKDFTVGSLVGSAVTWIAARRLNNFFRINLSVGVAAIAGMWRLGTSLDSCLDNIIALDGSRIQRELVNILVQKYQHDHGRMQLISKHFYSEKVFDDSSSNPDQAKLRWRYRNLFVDNVAYNQRTHDSDSSSDSDVTQTDDLESKQVPVNELLFDCSSPPHQHMPRGGEHHSYYDTGVNLMAYPLDCILGYNATGEEIYRPDTSSSRPTRVLNRRLKRSQRRHRIRHKDISSDSPHLSTS